MEETVPGANFADLPEKSGGPVLAWYWREKRKFYTTHSYASRNLVPIPPVTILAKKDAGGNVTECHVGPAVLSQAQCIVLLTFLANANAVPLVAGLVKKDPLGASPPRIASVTAPETMEEAILLLEDIPWPPTQGVLVNVYPPPSVEEGNAVKILATTTTILTMIKDAKRVPTVPVVVGNIISSSWVRAEKAFSTTLLQTGDPAEAREAVEAELAPALRRVVQQMSSLQGRTLTFYLNSKTPPLGVLPVFV